MIIVPGLTASCAADCRVPVEIQCLLSTSCCQSIQEGLEFEFFGQNEPRALGGLVVLQGVGTSIASGTRG